MFTFPGEARAMAFRRRRRNLDELLDEYAEERRELEALYAHSQPPEEFLYR